MSDETKMPHGAIAWIDLTVSNAVVVRDFYKKVVGWDHAGCDMGGYEDFNMMPGGTETPVAGVCHAVGSNEGMPASWMIYITVEDVETSARRCVEQGGEGVDGPRKMGPWTFCVIRDPAGAVSVLIEG